MERKNVQRLKKINLMNDVNIQSILIVLKALSDHLCLLFVLIQKRENSFGKHFKTMAKVVQKNK